MPINQLFINGEIKVLNSDKTFVASNCTDIEKDKIDWDDAESLVKSYKTLLTKLHLGDFLAFALTQTSLNNLLGQAEGLDAIKIYLAFSEADNTIRAFAIASKLNTSTGEFDDYKIPLNKSDIALSELPNIANVRPCPHQCGVANFLNKH